MTKKHWDTNGHPGPKLPPVGNQGLSESCAAWAYRTVAACQRRLMRRPISIDLTDPKNAPSAAFLHNYAIRFRAASQPLLTIHQVGRDFDIEEIVQVLKSLGASSEFDAPFTSFDEAAVTQAVLDDAGMDRCCWIQAATQLTFLDLTSDALRRALKTGPAVAKIAVFADFDCGVAGDYVKNSTDYRGLHLIAVVGFDTQHVSTLHPTARLAFLFMNSWGTDFGIDGFTWIDAMTLFGPSGPNNMGLINSLYQIVAKPSRSKCDDDTVCVGRTLDPPTRVLTGGATWTPDAISNVCRGLPPIPPAPSPQPRIVTYSLRNTPYIVLRSPRIPLVAALLHSSIRYKVRGRPAAKIVPKRAGYALLTGDLGPDNPLVNQHPVFAAGDEVGADRTTIGAWVDRANFWVTDAAKIHVGVKLPVTVEVSDVVDGPPRYSAHYLIQFIE